MLVELILKFSSLGRVRVSKGPVGCFLLAIGEPMFSINSGVGSVSDIVCYRIQYPRAPGLAVREGPVP